MSSHFLKRIGISAGALTGIVVAAAIITSRAQADQWDKMTLLTVDQPTQVGDTYLEPGTYMFRLLDWDRHIVEIATKDRSRVLNIILAIPAYRVEVTGDPQFTFYETPPETPKAVRTWFYPGDHDGQEFRYPTQWKQIAAVTPLVPAPQPPPAVQSEVAPAPAPVAAEPEPPAAQAVEQAPAAEQPPVEIAQVEIAQNNAQEVPAPQPQPSQAEDQTLPQTASPYPLIGLGGLLSLCLYALLRVKTVVS